MDILLEIFFELLIDGGTELSKNKKVSKWIRYPIIFISVIFVITIFIIFAILANTMLQSSDSTKQIIGVLIVIGELLFATTFAKHILKQLKNHQK